MKVYIVIEPYSDNCIRCVTLKKSVADNICFSFEYLNLKIIEKETIDSEDLIS
jgi:hypothetical protein